MEVLHLDISEVVLNEILQRMMGLLAQALRTRIVASWRAPTIDVQTPVFIWVPLIWPLILVRLWSDPRRPSNASAYAIFSYQRGSRCGEDVVSETA